MYKATIIVLGNTYKASGKTPAEAISKLKPLNCKGKGILTIDNGEKTKERVLMPAITFRLFNGSQFSKDVALKNISLMFEGL